MPVFEIFNHDEETTPTYQVTLLDEAGVAIPDVDLDTLVLTFYDRNSGEIINSRAAQDVLNTNDVVVAGGVVTWSMQVLDTPVVDDTLDNEMHIALWQWTYSPAAPTLQGKHETRLRVKNFTKVP